MYSKKLKQELMEYFQEIYGIAVPEENVDQYLDAIADFYIALVDDG
jgi:hypothetical protein